jgi:hypothetical protein
MILFEFEYIWQLATLTVLCANIMIIYSILFCDCSEPSDGVALPEEDLGHEQHVSHY